MKKHYLSLILAGILYGGIVPSAEFFSGRGLSLFEVAFWSSLIPGLVLALVMMRSRRYLPKRELWPLLLLFGFFGSLLGLFQWGSVILGVPIAIVALLLYTQPVWTTLFGRLFFKESITLKKVGAVVLSLLGIAILLKPWEGDPKGGAIGYGMALAGGVLLSLWIIISKLCGKRGQHPIGTAVSYSLISSLWLLALWPVLSLLTPGQAIMRFDSRFSAATWLFLLGVCVLTQAVPHLFFYTAIGHTEAQVAGVVLMLEPVSAAVVAAIAFRQPLGPGIILGGALILLADSLVVQDSESP